MADWTSDSNKQLLARQLGRRLREARIDSELLLDQVAGLTGSSQQHISDCERGRRLPSIPLLVSLADAYQVLLVDLLVGVYPFGSATRPRRLPSKPPDGRAT
ncbi:helix-turn-helix domain-containing protein [Nocardioides panacis]|uniref:Helix-turn-helix domain-containing protein n=1 Tax=Nocardioides panacis TaxID=2849501 RepID=A0A975T1C1_9ACTN|nr:helix-turn-helix transcriptional regulator [Nocardioides panacis]QWZ09676.1 helix-turn-helix domain-containing protein [Nocardioides panacis]